MNDTKPLRPRWMIPAIVAGVLVLVASAGLIYFFSGDEPEEVSLEAAVAAVTSTTPAPTTTTEAGAGDETTTTAAVTTTTEAGDTTTQGIDGSWAVDTSLGTFDFESATGSFVGFRIGETLGQGIGETEAVGRTGEVSGTMVIVGTEVTSVDVEADLSTITTNDSRRDNRARGALNTSEFPIAGFTMTEPIALPDDAADGASVSAQAAGELTVNDTTQPVMFEIEAQLVDDVIVVVASTEITFADYGVEVPSAGIVLAVDDNGIVEMQLLFTRS